MKKKKNIQCFEWGYIEWIYEPDPGSFLNNMSIGITTILPNKRQNKHIHYGDEQFIYVLSGEGTQQIGNKLTEVKPKQIHHMEAGIIHETINNRDKPIKHILISIPANYDQSIPFKKEKHGLAEKNDIFDENITVNDEIRYIFDRIITPLNMPVTIFDKEGKKVIQGGKYPDICMQKCITESNDSSCPIYALKGEYDAPHYTNTSAYICPHGLTVLNNPIMLNNKNIGIIKGGHIRTTVEDFDSKENIVPKGTVNAILLQLKNLSENIQNYYIFKNEEIKLNKQEIIFEETIKLAKEKMLNIQVSNHFLFNTLNALAGMAVKEGAYGTYQSILDMSRMLRYTSNSENSSVKLKDEIQYIQNYINLQKLRYGDKLNVIMDISPDILASNIPFNCLQPIVENCFIHGFQNMKDEMIISISGMHSENEIIIEIKDNGIGVDKDTLETIREKIINYEKYSLRGLLMTYSKLRLYFGGDFKFLIDSTKNNGMSAKIIYNF